MKHLTLPSLRWSVSSTDRKVCTRFCLHRVHRCIQRTPAACLSTLDTQPYLFSVGIPQLTGKVNLKNLKRIESRNSYAFRRREEMASSLLARNIPTENFQKDQKKVFKNFSKCMNGRVRFNIPPDMHTRRTVGSEWSDHCISWDIPQPTGVLSYSHTVYIWY